jgi:hypothetical protein
MPKLLMVFGLVACAPASNGATAHNTTPVLPAPASIPPGAEARSAAAVALKEPTAPCAEQPGPAAVALPERVTVGEFWQAMATQVELLDTAALQGSYAAFAQRHQLDPETPGLRGDFVRLWAAFEATRDGGWWRLRWAVTDREPRTHEIWRAWRHAPFERGFDVPSAVAECDEITALFSVAARRLGVRGVGLFYPTWNHVIAGWLPEAISNRKHGAVVLVPTTQIFLSCESTFDQTSFAAPKKVYEYPLRDTPDDTALPKALGEHLLEQLRQYGEATPELLALIRAKRAELLGSSVGDCSAYRAELAASLTPRLTCSDRRALRHLAARELDRPAASDAEILAFLAN